MRGTRTEPTSGSDSDAAAQPTGWIRRLTADCFVHRRVATGALGVTFVAAAIDISFPLLTRAAVDGASTGRTDAITTIVTVIAGLAVVRFGCQFGRRLLAGALSIDVQHDLRLRLLASLQRLDGSRQDEIRVGQVVSRSISDLQLVQGLLAMVPLSAGALLQFVLALGVMAYLSPLLTLVTLAVLPAIALLVFRVRPVLYAATWSAQQRAAELAGHVEETVTGVRVVKGFGQESRAIDILENVGRRLYAERLRTAVVNARFAPAMAALPQLGLVGIVALGGWLALDGSITVGTFLAFASYLATMSAVTRTLTSVLVMAQLSRAAVERVYEVIDTEPRHAEPADPTPLPSGPLGVAFRDVRFGFDPDHPVLDALDLTVGAGETVAIVGPSGSGKSTLSMLLPRFYRPTSGRIELVGEHSTVDIADCSSEDLRGVVGVAFDDPFLFSTSVADNIALGAADATDDAVRDAAERAMADGFVSELAQGYDTTVGERGLTLSGGQRQRIALARVLLARPRVLVLDDATSAVDAATEARIFDALRAGPRTTTVVLAHRRSTLSLADRVAVLDAGRVVDIGTEAELDARCALFRELMSGDPSEGAPAATPSPSAVWPDPPAPVTRTDGALPDGDLPDDALPPEMAAAALRLPPADEDPRVDTAAARREDPTFTLRRTVAPVAGLLTAVMLCLAFDSAVTVAFPSIVRFAVDHGVQDGSTAVLALVAAAALVLVVLDWIVVRSMTVLTARAGERVLFGLRVRSYAHLQRLGLDYYERELSGRIMTRMTTDVDALSSFMQTGLSTAVVSLLTIVGVSVALVATDPELAAVALSVVPVLVVATIVFRRISSRAYSTSRERISAVNADFQENVTGLRVAQAYRHERRAARTFQAKSSAYRHSRMRSQRAISVFFPFITFLSDLALAAVVLVGASRVASGETSTGALVAFVLYLGLLFGPIQQLSQVFDGYQQAAVGLGRIGDLLRTRSSIEQQPPASTVTVPRRLRGAVDLRGVSFRYAGAARDALTDVDLHIPAGATAALVGRTGAGKSTIVKLVARFYDPTAGAVEIDGTAVDRYPLADYRRRLGVVPQEAHLFSGTVASNIAFGRPDASRDEIEKAARAVGALPAIAALPRGMETPVGERGRGLAAGTRQLLALARAELVEPDILLLDEATATLDPATERAVLDAGATVTERRTSIVVAHRLATAARADMIAVVDDGRIAEIGTHAELIARNGRYAHLWATTERRGHRDEHDAAHMPSDGVELATER